jgi:hypothetical protein
MGFWNQKAVTIFSNKEKCGVLILKTWNYDEKQYLITNWLREKSQVQNVV